MKIKLQNLLEFFLPIIFSFIVIYAALINYIPDSDTIYFKENSFLATVVFAFLYICFKKNPSKNFASLNERNTIIIISTLITFIYVISYLTHNYYVSINYINSAKFVIFCFVKIIGYFIIFYSIVYKIFKLLPKINIHEKENQKQNQFFTNNKKSFFTIFILIMIFNIPYFIDSYPGYISYDFAIQIRQALGYEPIVNHHPYLSTYVIKFCVELGYKITNNYNFGIFIYTLFQTSVFAAVSSYFILSMAAKNIKKGFRVFVFIAIVIFPYFNFYNTWLTKDVIFAFGIYLLSLQLWKITTNKNRKTLRNYILLFISLLVIIIFRKNGIYITFLLATIFLIFVKKDKKPLLAVFSVVIILFTVADTPIRNQLGIKNGSVNEMFSIPIQQMARIYKYDKEKLSENEKNDILSYFNSDKINELYDPLLSDPVKAVMKDNLTNNEKLDFLKLSLKLFIKYPSTSFKSFVCTTYNFYYINNEQFRGLGGFKQQSKYSEEVLLPKELSIKSGDGIGVFRKIDNILSTKKIPVLNSITNTGFFVNLYIILIGYIIYTKKYKKIIAFCPIIFVFLTQLAGPVVDQRYTYSLILAAPLLICITLYKNPKSKKL